MSGCAGFYEETMDGKTWTSVDAMASEKEVSDFMFGLIRLLKPRVVLETGTYFGDTTKPMAEAMRENNHMSQLHTCDTNLEYIQAASKRMGGVNFHVCTGEELCRNTCDVDLAFLDSSGDRLAEAKALRMKPGGIVVLHDARRPVKEAIERELGWKSIFIPTPRGLALFQVP
jgi:predicted O-methyltransferase YrrM